MKNRHFYYYYTGVPGLPGVADLPLYLKFNESSGTTAINAATAADAIGNGTISGAQLSGGSGGYTFDGSSGDVVTVSNAAAVQGLDEFTLMIQINASDGASSETIIAKNGEWALTYDDAVGRVTFTRSTDSTDATFTQTSDPMLRGDWHLLVVRVDAALNVSLWVDGEAVPGTATQGTGTAVSNTHAITIGNDAAGTAHYFGSLRQVGMWDRALSDGEVDQIARWYGGRFNDARDVIAITFPYDRFVAGDVTPTATTTGVIPQWRHVANDGRVTWYSGSTPTISASADPETLTLYCRAVDITQLWLASESLTGSIPAGIFDLTNLTSLRMNSNSLTSEIPAGIGNLTKLTQLRLSFNSLEGEIPAEIGQLTQLTEVWLHFNNFDGVVPVEIGQLTQLRTLWLFGNSLLGANGLGGLTAIRDLGLYNNGMSQASVDAILSDLADNVGAFTYATPELDISGTNAAPSTAGSADVATLTGNGWSVTTS